ncbi:MAG: hypothetical protein ACFFAO_14105, partial [Candidatus Hermodarchaeota archaeon]
KYTLNQHNSYSKNGVIGSNTIKDINNFINFFSILSNLQNIDIVFQKIFNKTVSQINYLFFRCFLKSFNTQFFTLIEKENDLLSEDSKNELLTFNIIVEHISRMLFVLVDKIFLRNNIEDASKNFIDPRGRYQYKNIALRVLELFIFQEINFSDDIWPEYLLSMNRDKLRKDLKEYIEISDKYFYSDKDLTKFLTIYNLQSFSNAHYFEEWIIKDLIIPLNTFIRNIRNSIKDKSNKKEIHDILKNYLFKDIKSIKKELPEIDFVCNRIAQFWFEAK